LGKGFPYFEYPLQILKKGNRGFKFLFLGKIYQKKVWSQKAERVDKEHFLKSLTSVLFTPDRQFTQIIHLY